MKRKGRWPRLQEPEEPAKRRRGQRVRFARVPQKFAAIAVVLAATVLPAADVPRHGVFEATLTAAQDSADPLKEKVNIVFRSPSGDERKTFAFWDGGRVWKIRFSPDRTGRWIYRIEAADKTLQASKGEFRVIDSKNPGAPRLSKDRHHFVTGDDKPWFWLSDTAWNGALLSTDEEWGRYLDDRKAKRFSAVQFVTTQWRAGRKDELGQVAFTLAERLEINPAFFQRMDRKIRAVAGKGLVAAPVMLWALASRDRESPGSALSDEQAGLLARYMSARWGAYPVIWILAGDGDYRGEKAQRWKTIGSITFPEGYEKRLVTMHPGGMHWPWPGLQDQPWLDFLMYQSGHGSDAKKWRWNAAGPMTEAWKLTPARPLIDGEPNYEGHLSYQSKQEVTDYDVRRAVYYSLLNAPVAGVTYGAHGIWYWSRKREVPLDHPNSGIALPWHECIDYPGAKQMKVMRDLFDSIEWWKLRPDRSLLAEDVVADDFSNYVMAAKSQSGDFALLYLPKNARVKLNLGDLAKGSFDWLDPRTGVRKRAESSAEPQPPSSEDWLLLIRR